MSCAWTRQQFGLIDSLNPRVKEQHVSKPDFLRLLVCVAALPKTVRSSGTEQRDDGTQCLYRENVSDVLRMEFLSALCFNVARKM